MVLGEKVVSDTKGKEVIVSSESNEDQVLVENNKSKEEISKLSVLIVDDHSFIRLMHRAMVTNLGFEPQLAENGQKAVDLHRAGASFDLILMDRDMPVMNGTQATKELRAMGVETMIVGVTGDKEGPERRDFAESGLNGCFTKPISAKDIAGIVKMVKENKEKAVKLVNDDNV